MSRMHAHTACSGLLLLAVIVALAGCQRDVDPAAKPAESPVAGSAAATTSHAERSPATLEPGSIPVNADNFTRAESDLYLNNIVKEGGFGKFSHRREVTPIDKQNVIRLNRDTLYSAAVFDLDAGPVTITLPDTGQRFMSMQIIDEDQYTSQVLYTPGSHTFTRESIGTRYVVTPLRILVNPNNPEDVKQVHALQDTVKVEQPGGPGTFDIPEWDPVSQTRVREALLSLAADLPDTRRSFGTRAEVDPVRRLISSASAWGGNPDRDALYLNVTPTKNDGTTVHRVHVVDVPVDGFWSISVYNAKGFFESNPQNAYSINNVTAKKNDDGSVDVQFGGCDDHVSNCLPITPGWNYMVRLYRPKQAALDGTWTFPEAQPVQ